MDLAYGIIGRVTCALAGVGVAWMAWEFIWQRFVQHERLKLYHVEGRDTEFILADMAEARDMADWFEERGVLESFWVEEVEV